MKAYIQTDVNGDYYNVNAYIASIGYKALGFEVIKYLDTDEITNKDKTAIIVGGVGMVRKRLNYLGIEKPNEIEYPEELKKFLNRTIWTSSLKQVLHEQKTGIFIKPVETKLFQGRVISNFKDMLDLNYPDNTIVWCSDVVDIVTEWRCFVRYKTLFDVRYYKGKWDSILNLDIVNNAILKYTNQPAAYCLDFGVDKNGKHYLIEVNDGHSLGSYGMGAVSYAKFLSARWSELTNTEDYLNF